MRRLAAAAVAAFLAALGPQVAAASNDPLRKLQYGLDRVHAEPAWARTRGPGVIVAVIDTGVDLAHEDLRDRILPGRDFVDDDDVPQDENGHGTHVAGLAAATADNGLGIAGVAPQSAVMPLRVLGPDGTGIESDVAAAIRYAVLGAQSRGMRLVINLSLTDLKVTGNAATSRLIDDAVREAWFAGAVIVAAAGNESLGATGANPGRHNVLLVGATDGRDRRAAFSNRGVHIVAPGEKVVSTFWDPATPEDHSVYASGSGTSMAAPLVSGAAALLLATGLTNEQAVERILSTVDDLGPAGRDPDFGYGRLNVSRAVGVAVAGSAAAAPPPAPVPITAEGEFEQIGTPVPSAAAAPPVEETGGNGRALPSSAAAVLLLAAYAASRWNAAAEAQRADGGMTGPWEL